MKHITRITKKPRRAQSLSVGSIIVVISQLLAVAGEFFAQKEASEIQEY